MRTFDEQHQIYLQGRDPAHPGHVVTTVDAGDSAHQYGVASDAVHDKDSIKAGLQPEWDDLNLTRWAEAARAQGLDAGAFWTGFIDRPHAQLNLKKYGLSPRKQLKAAYLHGGLVEVYNLLDTFKW